MKEQLEEAMLERRVVSMHSAGMPPSAIDSRVGLEPGTAHDVMVARWRREKLMKGGRCV